MAHLGLGVQDYGRRISMGAAVSFCGDQYMTPVQNQGKNNSCAAFAVSAALSALVAAEAIRNPFISAPNLSKQEIVDCFPIGKEGLYIQFSYGYVIGRGLHTEEEYEYVGDGLDHECRCFHLRGLEKMANFVNFCRCGDEVVLTTSWTNDNPGRRFYACKNYRNNGLAGCNYFAWCDPPTPENQKKIILGLLKKKRELDALLKENEKQQNWKRLCLLIACLVMIKVLFFGKSKTCCYLI